MTAGAAGERWPQFDFHGVEQVMFHPDAGVLDPDRAIAAMLRLAAASGADVRFETPVTRLSVAPAGDGAVAHTDSGAFAAPVIAVAAGAWIAPLLDGLVELPPLTVTQQQVFHFAPAPGAQAARDATEPWPIFIDYDEAAYIFGLPAARWRGARRDEDERTRPRYDHRCPRRDFRVDPDVTQAAGAPTWASACPPSTPYPVNEATCPTRGPRTRTSSSTGRRPVRRRLALLGPRREVRAAARQDHRRPGEGRGATATPASPFRSPT